MARRHHKQNCDPWDWNQAADELDEVIEVGEAIVVGLASLSILMRRAGIDRRATMPARSSRRQAARPPALPDPFTREWLLGSGQRPARKPAAKRRK